MTVGAIGSIFSVLLNFAGPGDEVLLFEPYFTIYVNNIDFSGAKIVTAPMNINEKGEWYFDFEIFESKINERTKVVLITNPHNPTGKIFTESEV